MLRESQEVPAVPGKSPNRPSKTTTKTRVTTQARAAKPRRIAVLIGTRKGAWVLRTEDRRSFRLEGPHFFGQIVNHLVQDPRAPRTLVAAVRAGHLGPTVFRSTDFGRTWKESSRPPAFTKKSGRSVGHVFYLTPGHPSEPGVWWAGTSPQGLFRSGDGGDTWQGVAGFNDHPDRVKWTGGDKDGPPDGATTHSILIDPRDAGRMYLGLSAGGFFESDDQGVSWRPLNRGVAMDFMPKELKDRPYGHDPHDVRFHPARPDRFYMQNHCGIYRLDRPGERWIRIGDNMPKTVGDIGFPVAVHPRDPDTAWVFPMDGTSVWPRTSIGGRPALYRTTNAGKSWQRQARGLPPSQTWYTVKRQCLTTDDRDPVGLYFGTTSGDVWASRDEGASFRLVARGLPHVYSVVTAKY